MTTPLGDLPDWELQVNPAITSVSFDDQGAGPALTLAQSANPFRIWAAWLDVTIASGGTFAGGPSKWGARIGDGGGHALLRVQRHVAVANHEAGGSLSIAMPGFTPQLSAGFYTVNLVTDAGITALFTRASGGILISQP